MNRHQVKGYQKNIKNDVYHIEDRLQEYDPDLYIMYNPNDGTHLIMDGITELAVMRIPQIGFEYLDARVLQRIRQIHVVNGYSASWELQEAEDRKHREEERVMSDLSYEFAKESKEAFINAFDYGRESGVQKYVNGVA